MGRLTALLALGAVLALVAVTLSILVGGLTPALSLLALGLVLALAAAKGPARLSHAAFLSFFVLYIVGAIAWLATGLMPALATAVPPLHQDLHAWGGGDRTVRVLVPDWNDAEDAFEQVELTLLTGGQAVIDFENQDTGVRHNVAIYRDSSAREAIFRGDVIAGPARDGDEPSRVRYSFPAPPPGTYYFRCDVHPSMGGSVTVARDAGTAPSPRLTELARGVAVAMHDVEHPAQVFIQYVFSVVNVGLGVLLIWLRSRDRVARLLAIGMVGTGAVFNLQAHAADEVLPALSLPHEAFHMVAGVAYAFALALFPDGKFVPGLPKAGWFKWPLRVLYLGVLTWLGLVLGFGEGEPEPYILSFGVIIPIVGLTSQALRSRRAVTAEERQQSRVLLWALALAFGAAMLLGLFALVAHLAAPGVSGQWLGTLRRFVFVVFPPLFAVIPITLVVVMVRYRLWDIDRVINRALVYGVLTGTLGLAYLLTVILLGGLLTAIVGQRANSVVVAASTLAVAASFRPARRRIQAFIDRRFYRHTYDAARTLATFGAAVRDEVDLNRLSDNVLGVVEETLQPAHVSLWLRPSERRGQGPSRNGSRSSPETNPR
ncbi:MAG: hypothetical protein M3Q10_07345 [Chloroflexota bacterium]|nr:hypothetical protein [Chloroflexota bacterium]